MTAAALNHEPSQECAFSRTQETAQTLVKVCHAELWVSLSELA